MGTLAPHRPMLAACLVVFGLALLLRSGLVLARQDAVLHGDPLFYSALAVHLGKAARGAEAPPGTWRMLFAKAPLQPVVACAVLACTTPELFREKPSYEALAQKKIWLPLRLLWSAVDAATCALIAAIAWLLFERRAGWASGVLCACFPSLVLVPLRLYPQTWAAAGVALALLLLVLGLRRPDRRALSAAGLSIGLAGQFLPPAIGLPLPLIFLPGLLFAVAAPGSPLRPGLRLAGPVLAGHLVVWLVRWAIELPVLGGLASLGQPVRAVEGFWQLLASNGWAPDSLLVAAPARSSGLFAALTEHPLSSLHLVALNMVRLWQYPSNVLREECVLDFAGQSALQQGVLVLAIAFLPPFLAVRRAVALVLSPVLCLTGAYALCHVETRYVLTVAPLFLLLAAAAAARIVDTHAGVALPRGTCARLAAGGLLVVGCSTLFPPDVLGSRSGLRFAGALTAAVCLWSALTAVGLALFSRGLQRAWGGATSAATWGAVGAGALVAFATFGTSAWHEWSVRLSPPAGPCEAVRTTLGLPPAGLAPGKAWLLLDARGQGLERLEITVNGTTLPKLGTTRPTQAQLHNELYRTFLAFWQGELASERHWHALPIPPAALALGGVEVVVRLGPGDGPASVEVFGDSPDAFSGRNWQGPRLGFHHANRSLYQWLWGQRDPRLDGWTSLSSTTAKGARLDGGAWREDDLSPRTGVQSGEYRIRVVVLPPGVDRPSADLPDAGLAFY